VAAGAAWPAEQEVTANPRRASLDWWSLQRPKRAALPKIKNRAWVRNPIDAFLLAALEKRGLSPTPPADRAILIRRATYDLLGIPPTPAEIQAFLRDARPDA